MACWYLKTMTVPIPWEEGPIVIRHETAVEFQLDRTYQKGGNSRVKRRVIGKKDPADSARMYPNENYFQLIPNNPVPDEIRDRFLAECEGKRKIAEMKKNPEEIVESVLRGLDMIQAEGEKIAMEKNGFQHWEIQNASDYRMIMEMFNDIYNYIDFLAEKTPNEVVNAYKVSFINELLNIIRTCTKDESTGKFLRLIDPPTEEEDERGKKQEKGMTYSDVFMILKWYKCLPKY